MPKSAYDVIVLGSGCAGMAAAVAATEAGFSTLLVEKADSLGGGTTASYGLLWAGINHLAQEAGLSDTREDVIKYMAFLGGGEVEPERVDAFVDTAPVAIRFFEDCGAKFQIVRGVSDHYYGIAPGGSESGRTLEAQLISGFELGPWQHRVLLSDASPQGVTATEQAAWGGPQNFSNWDRAIMRDRHEKDMRGKGRGLISQLLKCLIPRKPDIVTGHRISRLKVKGDRVVGVVDAAGEEIEARKGVVLATGGYESNPDMVRDLEGAFPDVDSQMPSTVTGDGLVLGLGAGSAVRKINNNMAMILAFRTTDPDGKTRLIQAGIVELFSPHTMVVNKFGRRFADETFFQGMVPALRDFDTRTHEFKNLPCYLIFDSQFAEKYSFGMKPVGTPMPDAVSRSSTISGLASDLGIEADELHRTVERYNGYVRAGKDDDFHRGENKWRLVKLSEPSANPTLGSISKPPFFGVKLGYSITSSAGLLCNQNGQVVNMRKHPIPGLYASGVAAARTESGAGYQAGMNLASGLTFSYRAVQHMKTG